MIVYPNETKLNENIIFDSHSHYDDVAFSDCLDYLLNEQLNNGVYGVLSCGVDKNSSLNTLKLSENYPNFYVAVGIHPENLTNDYDLSFIKELSKNKRVVAIGEIGLDYHFNDTNKQFQLDVFEKQIILAKELNLPIIVHDRDAHADTLSLLQKYKPQGVVHCFSGSEEMAKEILKIGMYIGVGGVVTFKNAKKLPDVVKIIPDDRLLIETDCPYLAPEPLRGKICHSGLIPFTADKIAEIRNTTRLEVLKTTLNNAKRLFSIK